MGKGSYRSLDITIKRDKVEWSVGYIWKHLESTVQDKRDIGGLVCFAWRRWCDKKLNQKPLNMPNLKYGNCQILEQ